MNIKTFIILFLLGLLVSCSSKRNSDDKNIEKDPIFPDYYRSL